MSASAGNCSSCVGLLATQIRCLVPHREFSMRKLPYGDLEDDRLNVLRSLFKSYIAASVDHRQINPQSWHDKPTRWQTLSRAVGRRLLQYCVSMLSNSVPSCWRASTLSKATHRIENLGRRPNSRDLNNVVALLAGCNPVESGHRLSAGRQSYHRAHERHRANCGRTDCHGRAAAEAPRVLRPKSITERTISGRMAWLRSGGRRSASARRS